MTEEQDHVDRLDAIGAFVVLIANKQLAADDAPKISYEHWPIAYAVESIKLAALLLRAAPEFIDPVFRDLVLMVPPKMTIRELAQLYIRAILAIEEAER